MGKSEKKQKKITPVVPAPVEADAVAEELPTSASDEEPQQKEEVQMTSDPVKASKGTGKIKKRRSLESKFKRRAKAKANLKARKAAAKTEQAPAESSSA